MIAINYYWFGELLNMGPCTRYRWPVFEFTCLPGMMPDMEFQIDISSNAHMQL